MEQCDFHTTQHRSTKPRKMNYIYICLLALRLGLLALL